MRLHLIVAQRKCSYPGQYAPEALEVADDNTMEGNPEWLPEMMDHLRKASDLERVEILVVNIPDSAVEDVLRSSPPEVDATVERSQP